MQRIIFFMIFIVLAESFLIADVWARNHNHVRIVLDLSWSLRNTDSERLLLLSTGLLHDLAKPNTSMGDSFKVYPFDRTLGNWKCSTIPEDHPSYDSNNPIPNQNREPEIDLASLRDNRDKFLSQIKTLDYDAPCTYFSPGINRAITDLISSGDQYDGKIIFLLTDGLPDSQEEQDIIKNTIVPKLQENNILLYVLAFGEQAFSEQAFFDSVKSVGGVRVLPTSKNLLVTTVKLFADGFGYDITSHSPPLFQLDLNKNLNPSDATVIVFSHKSNTPPSLLLSEPPKINSPFGLQKWSSDTASYTLELLLGPEVGQYPFNTDINNINKGEVVVIRRTPIEIEIRPHPPWTNQTSETIALVQFPLMVRTKPQSGKGTPPDASISAFAAGTLRKAGLKYSCRERYSFCANPVSGSFLKASKEGRDYEIKVKFPVNKANPQAGYPAHIEITAEAGNSEIGSLIDQNAHKIYVYPPFSLRPAPPSQTLPELSQSATPVCTNLSLTSSSPVFPLPDHPPEYEIELRLAHNTKQLKDISNALNNVILIFSTKDKEQQLARFDFLDGKVSPSATAKLRLTKQQLTTGEYQICFHLTRHKVKLFAPEQFKLQLLFVLNQSPYNRDEFIQYITEPYTLDISIVKQSFDLKWISLLILIALLLLALFWYTRSRPSLPNDLGYAISPTSASSTSFNKSFKLLEEISSIKGWLGLVVEKPIFEPTNNRILAWVRPSSEPDELYILRLEKGVSLDASGDSAIWNKRPKLIRSIEIYRTYQLNVESAGSYLFRLEYDDKT